MCSKLVPTYVGMVTVDRAGQYEKAKSLISTREVGRNTLARSELSKTFEDQQ